MSRIREIRDEIAKTKADLEENVQMLEHEAKEAVEVVKEMLEQGAERVRDAVQTISPTHQMRKHPGIVQGACFGLGLYLAKSRIGTTTNRSSIARFGRRPSRATALLEPIALGIATAIAGKVLKKRLPMFESQLDGIQSALITEFSYKFLREVTDV